MRTAGITGTLFSAGLMRFRSRRIRVAVEVAVEVRGEDKDSLRRKNLENLRDKQPRTVSRSSSRRRRLSRLLARHPTLKKEVHRGR
jgi:hypothetical protein